MIYAFARSNTMQEHEYNDDVALVRAINKKQAIQKFKKYYADVSKQEVFRVRLKKGICVLTDY